MRVLALTLAVFAGLAQAQPAQFRVTSEVVQERVQPFAATIAGAGNSLIDEGGGFEPVVYRTKLMALESAPDRVVASASALSHFDTLREGFLDEALVQVYRIENGSLQDGARGSCRRRRLPCERLAAAIAEDRLVAPSSPRFSFRWEPWNRPRATYYFTVRAVGASGKLPRRRPRSPSTGPAARRRAAPRTRLSLSGPHARAS